jgi:hypothetical protein
MKKSDSEDWSEVEVFPKPMVTVCWFQTEIKVVGGNGGDKMADGLRPSTSDVLR